MRQRRIQRNLTRVSVWLHGRIYKDSSPMTFSARCHLERRINSLVVDIVFFHDRQHCERSYGKWNRFYRIKKRDFIAKAMNQTLQDEDVYLLKLLKELQNGESENGN